MSKKDFNNEEKNDTSLMIKGCINMIIFFFIQTYLIYSRYTYFPTLPLWPFLIPLMFISIVITVVIFNCIKKY